MCDEGLDDTRDTDGDVQDDRVLDDDGPGGSQLISITSVISKVDS